MSATYYQKHLKDNAEYKKKKQEYDVQYNIRTKETRRLRGIAYREKNKERLKIEKAAYFQKNKKRINAAWNKQVLRYRYGLTPEQYDKILSIQNGVCAICGKLRLASNQKRMGVDHCHETEKVRGILCNWCNYAIGQLDNIETLKKAIEYLQTNGDNLDIGETFDATTYSLNTRGMKYLRRRKQEKQNGNSQTEIIPVARAV